MSLLVNVVVDLEAGAHELRLDSKREVVKDREVEAERSGREPGQGGSLFDGQSRSEIRISL